MPKNKIIKNNKCLICTSDIPKDRVGNAVTCKKGCAKVYLRVSNYVKSHMVSKHIVENRKLKEKIKVMESDKC